VFTTKWVWRQAARSGALVLSVLLQPEARCEMRLPLSIKPTTVAELRANHAAPSALN
jgi:hypothetical protein